MDFVLFVISDNWRNVSSHANRVYVLLFYFFILEQLSNGYDAMNKVTRMPTSLLVEPIYVEPNFDGRASQITYAVKASQIFSIYVIIKHKSASVWIKNLKNYHITESHCFFLSTLSS